MKKVFWLLDVNSETRAEKPEIWIWGIDDKGQRILIIERNFTAYFYLMLKDGTDAQTVTKNIMNRKEEFPSVLRLEPVTKKYFGKSVKAVQVFCQNPDVVTKYAKAMAKIEGVKESLEDDIRYAMRYIIDTGASPCSWHEIEVQETKNAPDVQVDKRYIAKSPPKNVAKIEVPKLRILGFSIIAYSSKGAAQPDRNPVVIISIATSDGKEEQLIAKNSNDEPLLKDFMKSVKDFDPDIIVGYGTNRQAWSYLAARAKKLGLRWFIDRANTELHMSVYGHVSITGRVNVDLFDFSDELPEVKLKTLEECGRFSRRYED